MTFWYSFHCAFAVLLLGVLLECNGFVPLSNKVVPHHCILPTKFSITTTTGVILQLDSSDTNTDSSSNNVEEQEDESLSTSTTASVKQSLQEKMKSWEATEEEIKAATLGGVVPKRSDAFDIGLYIAFPLMVVSGLAFALFPFIMGSLDVDGVGPPPTI